MEAKKSTPALEWRTLNLTVIGYTDTWDQYSFQTYPAEELYEGMSLKCPKNWSKFKSPILKQINADNVVVEYKDNLFTIKRGERVELEHIWVNNGLVFSEDLCVGLLNEAFKYVLDKIARNALEKLQMDPNDERYVVVVKLVLFNFDQPNTDEELFQYVQRYLENNNIQIPQEEVQKIICQTRANLKYHHLALRDTFKQIEKYNNLSGEEVYSDVSKLFKYY